MRARVRAGRRAVAALAAAGVALLGGVGLVATSGTPAGAAGPASGMAGYCPDDTGVTVVVDFQELGGGIVVRCATGPLGGDFTGIDALKDAGFHPQGTARYGLSFVCRIAGRPSADESLSIPGNPDYHEQCVDTPPQAAYWGYWYANDGGTWTYSSSGPADRDVIEGGFEGWSFSLNHPVGQQPPPGIAPERPTQPPTSTPPTTGPTRTSHPPSHRPTARPTHQPSTHPPSTTGGSGSGAGNGRPTAPTATAATGSAGSPGPPTGTGPSSAAHRHTGGVSTNGATGSSTSAPTSTEVENPVAAGHNRAGVPVSGTLPGDDGGDGSGGLGAGTVLGVLLIGALAVGGGVVAWRRRVRGG